MTDRRATAPPTTEHGSSAAELARDALVAELDRRVRTDELTQLASKAQMTDWLDAAPVGSLLGLIDIDDFRLLNQSLGHDAGDDILVLMGRRLQASCPQPDHFVARISQDEFAVLAVGPDHDPDRFAGRLADIFGDPFRIGSQSVGIRVTCGISVCAPGKSANHVIREADTAMYEAKSRSKGTALSFDESFHRRAVEAFEISEGLRRALADHELQIHYQPEIDLASGQTLAAEALLRWTHPTRGSIPPTMFIPVAEAGGMIGEIGRFVLDGALAQRRAWVDAGVVSEQFTMAVNLSMRQLDDPGFVGAVGWALAEWGCDPARLCLELTESALMADPVSAIARLDQLAALGVQLAIDDFGTGYSSLAYLQQLPITALKIDRGFVSRSDEQRGRTLTTAIVGIAEALGLRTIAEGIETADQERFMRQLGCDLGQGYLFSRPVAADRFADAVEAIGSAGGGDERTTVISGRR